MITKNMIVSGRVQGVGFRFFTESIANKYGLKGYVRNTRDNRVEILCQGEKEDIDLFVSEVSRGPAFAVITDIKIENVEINKVFNSFEIDYY